ncbi:MAG TPA: FkbM family methyltransferase [Vicinamibacterales bacterium]|nr:FkbM family methyltransferase [Vicinamibacterales bacterium]
MRLPILQGPLRGRWWIAGSSTNGCWLGSYEYAKQRLLAELISDGDCVFDVGANVGFYTLLAASKAGPSGRVIAFEPLPDNLRILRRHLQLNDVRNVTVIEAAAGDADGTAHFAPHAHNSMGSLSDRGAIVVDMVSLDTLAESGKVPIPRAMKIDVEGAELRVLRGAARLLERSRPIILLATHSTSLHRECCDFLRSAGYSLRPIDDSISSIDATDEILATPRDSHVTA